MTPAVLGQWRIARRNCTPLANKPSKTAAPAHNNQGMTICTVLVIADPDWLVSFTQSRGVLVESTQMAFAISIPISGKTLQIHSPHVDLPKAIRKFRAAKPAILTRLITAVPNLLVL